MAKNNVTSKDDSEAFYSEVARSCGKASLSQEEMDTAFRARQTAILEYELRGASMPPSPNLVFSVAWLVAQNSMSRGGLHEPAALVEAVITSDFRNLLVRIVRALESNPAIFDGVMIKRQCGLYSSDDAFLTALGVAISHFNPCAG